MNNIQIWILMTPVILFSLTVHEYSHGKVAFLLGDDTAKRLGRLSFNPLRHLDIMGVLFFYFVGFGWAKPVPVDWRNFHNPLRDMMYVAIAGPLSNVAMAVICSFILRFISPYDHNILFVLFAFGVFINVMLAIFNLLPVFPLDGSSVLKGLVSHETAAKLTHLDRYGAFVILGIFLLDRFAHTEIFASVLRGPITFIMRLLTQEAFPFVGGIFGLS